MKYFCLWSISIVTANSNSVINVKALVGVFNQEMALVRAFSVIVKTDYVLRSTWRCVPRVGRLRCGWGRARWCTGARCVPSPVTGSGPGPRAATASTTRRRPSRTSASRSSSDDCDLMPDCDMKSLYSFSSGEKYIDWWKSVWWCLCLCPLPPRTVHAMRYNGKSIISLCDLN